jgi:hypothetical protein
VSKFVAETIPLPKLSSYDSCRITTHNQVSGLLRMTTDYDAQFPDIFRDRVAKIEYKRGEKNISFGTGYLVSKTLVLTARHVLQRGEKDSSIDPNACYDLWFIGDCSKGEEWLKYSATLQWDSGELDAKRKEKGDLPLDLATLKLEQSPDFLGELQHNPNPRFGVVEQKKRGCEDKLNAKGFGFPQAQWLNDDQQSCYDNLPEPLDVTGTFSKGTILRRQEFVLNINSVRPATSDGWKGISGTALFVENRLIAVVTRTDKSFEPEALRAVLVKEIICNREIYSEAFPGKKPKYDSIPLSDVPPQESLHSNSDSVGNLNEIDDYIEPISIDDFLEKISHYKGLRDHDSSQRKLDVLDNISSHAWYFLTSVEDERLRSKIGECLQDNTLLSHLFTPLDMIESRQELDSDKIIQFLRIRKVNGDYLSDINQSQGYSKLLRRLIIHLLYQAPLLLKTDEIFKSLQELMQESKPFWQEFFVDIFLRYQCGNIRSLEDRLVQRLGQICDDYIEFNPQKPIVKLWQCITRPLEISVQKPQADVFQLIRECAKSSRKYVEFKWTIAATMRVMPLYERSEDEEDGLSFLNSLFEEFFKKKLAARSPQLQSIYLKGLLKSFLLTRQVEDLKKFEDKFKLVCKFLPPPSVSHLQLEYACCIYVLSQIYSGDDYSEGMQKLEIGKLIASNKNVFESPLFNNYLLKNNKEDLLRNNKTISLFPNHNSERSQISVEKFLEQYIILPLYNGYADPLIKYNHLNLREFSALFHVYSIGSKIANSTLASLKKSLNLQQEPSFYARSTQMLSRIPRNLHTDLICDYSTQALRADQYSLIRNAHDIIWGFYTSYYYGVPPRKADIKALSSEFGLLTGIVDDCNMMSPQSMPKTYWAYYAGIKWEDRPEEAEFIEALCEIELPRETYKISFRESEERGAEFPDEMHRVIQDNLSHSLLAAALHTNFDSPELWNIMGTTLMVNCETAQSLANELRKASRCYAIAKCLARSKRYSSHKYCFNFIKSRSLFLLEEGFILKEDIPFLKDTVYYLTTPSNHTERFRYNFECTEPYLELLQNELPEHWNNLYSNEQKLLSRLKSTTLDWLKRPLRTPKFKNLFELLSST